MFTALYFSYSNSTVECTDRNARELDATAKWKTWLGREWGLWKIKGLYTFFEKVNSLFLLKQKFPLVERQWKCHHLDNHWWCLHPGAFLGLLQLSSTTSAMVHNGVVAFRLKSCYEKFQHFFYQKWQMEAAVKYLLQSKDIVAILPTGFLESLTSTKWKSKTNANVWMLTQIQDMKELRVPSISVNKGLCTSVDWRSEIQACFQKTAEDFLDAN